MSQPQSGKICGAMPLKTTESAPVRQDMRGHAVKNYRVGPGTTNHAGLNQEKCLILPSLRKYLFLTTCITNLKFTEEAFLYLFSNVGTEHEKFSAVPTEVKNVGTEREKFSAVPTEIINKGTEHEKFSAVPTKIKNVGTEREKISVVPTKIKNVGTEHEKNSAVPT